MKMNILVVNDEPAMVESIRSGLEDNGYRSFGAFNVIQAYQRLFCEDCRIDLIITDCLLPTMNGLELLLAIRKSHPNLPILLLTPSAETGLLVEGVHLHNCCDGCSKKPCNTDLLNAEIERIKLYLLLPQSLQHIKKPLISTSCFAQLIRLTVENSAPVQENVERILATVKQVSRIRQEILHTGCESEDGWQPVELHGLLECCLEMFAGLFILKDVQVRRKIAAHDLWTLGDRFSLEQVFKSLILNAVDAMDGCAERRLVVTAAVIPDLESVEIVIEDTGRGIREALLPKVFKPRFADRGLGNGLGMELIKNIVEQHDGAVSVQSQVGVGSRFYVHLSLMEGFELGDPMQLNNERGGMDMQMMDMT